MPMYSGDERVFPLREVAKMTGIGISTWSQGVSAGMIPSVLLSDPSASKDIPKHHLDMATICKFEAYFKAGVQVPGMALTSGKKRASSKPDACARAAHNARLRAEMKQEAKEAGLTYQEYVAAIEN